jgi:hypothetical protein
VTRVKLEGLCVVTRRWTDDHAREPITTDHGDFFLCPGRILELEDDGMTTRVKIEPQHGDVEVRELEGAKSQPRTAAKYVVEEGSSSEVHVWQGHWIEVREAPLT